MRRCSPRPRRPNKINRAIGGLLGGYGRLATDAEQTVELYTRQSCLKVTARDLDAYATRASSGIGGQRVIHPGRDLVGV